VILRLDVLPRQLVATIMMSALKTIVILLLDVITKK